MLRRETYPAAEIDAMRLQYDHAQGAGSWDSLVNLMREELEPDFAPPVWGLGSKQNYCQPQEQERCVGPFDASGAEIAAGELSEVQVAFSAFKHWATANYTALGAAWVIPRAP